MNYDCNSQQVKKNNLLFSAQERLPSNHLYAGFLTPKSCLCSQNSSILPRFSHSFSKMIQSKQSKHPGSSVLCLHKSITMCQIFDARVLVLVSCFVMTS